MLGHRRGNALPDIADAKRHPALGLRGPHMQLEQALGRRAGRVLHGLHAVARQVQQHLLDHGAVAPHLGAARRDVGDHPHGQLARLQADQRHDGVEQVLGRDRLSRLLAPAHEIVHAADHLAGPLGLLGNALQRHQEVGGQAARLAGSAVLGFLQQID